MKKLLLIPTTLFAVLASFSQKPSSTEYTKIHMIETSKKGKIGACFLFVAGGVILTEGIAMNNESDNLDDAVYGIGVAVIGGACILSSIPLYLIASKNKKSAMSISINQQNLLVQKKPDHISGMQTALLLRVKIGKRK